MADLGRAAYELAQSASKNIKPVSNIIVNGNFMSSAQWAGNLATMSIDTANREANLTATARFGQLRYSFTLVPGHKYYFCALVKATSNLVKVDIFDQSVQVGVSVHSGSGQYEKISGVSAATNATNGTFRVLDYRTSGWDLIKIKNCALIDLTVLYGAGNEPNLADFENLLFNEVGSVYFDGSVSMNTALVGLTYPIGGMKDMVVNLSGNRIRCASKYSATKDLWIDFNKEGSNLLPQISAFYLSDNPSERVSPYLNAASAVTISVVTTDMIGPYVVKANANGNAESLSFTGGWHGYDNTGGDTRRTATNVSLKVYADGYLVSEGQTVTCDRIDIEVVNNVNGWNTKQADSLGRNVLTETVHYTVTPGSIEVSVDIKALEDITIQTYYGLQTRDGDFSTVHYVNGSQSGRVAVPADHDSGARSTYGNVDRWTLNKGSNNLIAWLDNSYGLGDRVNVPTTSPMAFSTAVGKTYMNLIRQDTIVTAGNVVSWRGGFVITESLPCNGADLAYTFKEAKQRKYVVDFLAASPSSLLQPRQDDRNKAVAVDSKSAAVTVGSRVGSLGLNLSTTGYGQAKITI